MSIKGIKNYHIGHNIMIFGRYDNLPDGVILGANALLAAGLSLMFFPFIANEKQCCALIFPARLE